VHFTSSWTRAVASLSLALSALAQEKRITRSDLPPEVEKAVAAQSSGASIRAFQKKGGTGLRFTNCQHLVASR